MKLALMIDVPNTIPNESYVRVPSGSFEETLALAAKLGFDGVELLVDHPNRADLSSLPAALAKTGLTVAAINSGRLYFEYGLGLVSEEPAIRTASQEALLALVYQTAHFQAPINIGVFRGLPQNGNQDWAIQHLKGILQETPEEIAHLRVKLVLEPGNKIEITFIYSTAEGIALVEQINRRNVSLMLDTFHMSVENETIAHSLSTAMPMLQHIHFLDRLRNPPSYRSQKFDFTNTLRTLHRHQYPYFISMPMLQNGNVTATRSVVSAIKRAAKYASTYGGYR
jgi:D-psicose/D-tagatose/L-ribulose 3-epimerase